MPASAPTFAVGEWSLRRLGWEDEALIQDLCERCADYTELVEGNPVSSSAAREFLAGAPDGWDPARLVKLGLFDASGWMAGLLDVVPGYPEADIWYIGLLMLDPAVRGSGLGARLYRALEAWVAEQGGRRVMLTVVEQNVAARRFWQRQDFEDIRMLPAKQMGSKLQSRWEMQRRLPARTAGSPGAVAGAIGRRVDDSGD